MIDAEQALRIADVEAGRRGWGEVPPDDYEACPFVSNGQLVFLIDRKDMMIIGKRLRFTIDAETGAILESRRMGTR